LIGVEVGLIALHRMVLTGMKGWDKLITLTIIFAVGFNVTFIV